MSAAEELTRASVCPGPVVTGRERAARDVVSTCKAQPVQQHPRASDSGSGVGLQLPPAASCLVRLPDSDAEDRLQFSPIRAVIDAVVISTGHAAPGNPATPSRPDLGFVPKRAVRGESEGRGRHRVLLGN